MRACVTILPGCNACVCVTILPGCNACVCVTILPGCNACVCVCSMYVSLEMVYLCQAFFISQDLTMYDKDTDTPTECHSSGLCADLGESVTERVESEGG